jgi:capsular polysaccharide biosynthesis protein
MLNETEILAALAGHNVTVVRPERWPLEEQVALFANARLIIGPQGAGIQNTLWAPRGCAVLELVNVRFFSGVYWTLTESLGQRYGAVTGISDSGTDPLRQGYTCDPAQVREAVDRLIALGPPSK